MLKTFDWKGNDPDGGSSVYSCKFIKPLKNAVLACGSNKHSVKVFSSDTGAQLHELTAIDPLLSQASLVCVDTSPLGRVALIGSANGQLHVKNLLITNKDDGNADVIA